MTFVVVAGPLRKRRLLSTFFLVNARLLLGADKGYLASNFLSAEELPSIDINDRGSFIKLSG